MIGLATALLVLAAGPAPARDPVAVLPFKNLGGDASLAWLSTGIADTMISDLRRAGVGVVERDQIERALTEILEKGTDEASAARAGRLVGARTVVLGGFQVAGSQLRINARFVDVETGVVKEAAKATGATSDPFPVQDQIVTQLLGASAKRPPRKTGPRTGDAYRLFAQASTAASDADRAALLKQAIRIDPELVYAKDALAALEERLAALEEARDAAALGQEGAWRALAFGNGSKDERATAANGLLLSLLQGRRYHRLLADAQRLSGTDLALPGGFRIAETADFCLVQGNSALRRLDATLQAGEQFLQRHPRSNYAPSVKVIVQHAIDDKRKRQTGAENAEKTLARVLAAETKASPGTEERAWAELQVCEAAADHHLYELAIARCDAAYRRWKEHPKADVRERALRAAVDGFEARYQLGRTVEARVLARELIAAHPGHWATASVRSYLDSALATDTPEDAR